MPCTWICHKDLKRFHWSCLFCRERKWAEGKYDRRFYTIANHVVRPLQVDSKGVYLLWPDPRRRFKRVKELVLTKILEIAELLAN
jgi:hypothetical protein